TLGAIPAGPADTFNRVAPLLNDESLRPVAVKTLLTVPAEARDPQVSAEAAEVLVQLAENTAASDRTTDDFLAAMSLADGLLARLPAERAKPLRNRLREVVVRVVVVKTVEEEMRYDVPYFAVEAGRPVQILLDNEDLMPHNLVVTSPGQLRDVAERGMEVGPKGGSAGNPYVPDGEDVLFASELVDAKSVSRLTFTAPSEPGEYPYVCTFPRHWMRMYGVMVVVPDLDAWLANPTVPEDPIGNTRQFVQKWTVDDLLPAEADVSQKLAGRSPEIGERLFKEATCSQCHRSDSIESLVGPSLVGVFDRWKGDGRIVLREMLDPSAHVDPKYAVRQVVTVQGQVVTGLVVAETEDDVSTLPDPEAKKPTVVLRDDILDSVQSDVSLMPKALLDRFTEDEVYELLAYLRGLEPPAAKPEATR
ncbi:MAG: plastocyanin/azurin family copper-binding protein, partial [Planctomycetota bacterium]